MYEWIWSKGKKKEKKKKKKQTEKWLHVFDTYWCIVATLCGCELCCIAYYIRQFGRLFDARFLSQATITAFMDGLFCFVFYTQPPG